MKFLNNSIVRKARQVGTSIRNLNWLLKLLDSMCTPENSIYYRELPERCHCNSTALGSLFDTPKSIVSSDYDLESKKVVLVYGKSTDTPWKLNDRCSICSPVKLSTERGRHKW